MAFYTFVLTVETPQAFPTDDEGDLVGSILQSVGRGFGALPATGWAPDRDTIADGIGCEYNDLRVVDLNP